MGFRDDGEALRLRSEALAKDLADTQQRLEEAEARGDGSAKELKQLRREVKRLRKKTGESLPTASRTTAVVVGLLAGLMLTAGVAVYFSMRTDDMPIAESASDDTKPADVAPEPTTTTVAFGATVLGADGRDLSGACVVSLEMGTGPTIHALRIVCGDDVLYDTNARGAGDGIEIKDGSVTEAAQGELFVYRLRYRYTGGEDQILLDSQRHRIRVWSEGLEPYDIRLWMDDRSAPRAGARLSAAEEQRVGGRLHLRAVVSSRTGPAPEVEACELVVHPTVPEGERDCRIIVHCDDGQTLYGDGNSGYNECSWSGGLPDHADDRQTTTNDTDPKLRLRYSDRTLRIEDGSGARGWRLDFQLEQHERCNLSGQWVGARSDGMGIYLTASGDQHMFTTDAADSMAWEATPTLDCARGTGVLDIDEHGQLEGRFGPRFESFVGRARSLVPWTFYLMRVAE